MLLGSGHNCLDNGFFHGDGRLGFDGAARGVEHDEVVAEAVHLGEGKGRAGGHGGIIAGPRRDRGSDAFRPGHVEHALGLTLFQ